MLAGNNALPRNNSYAEIECSVGQADKLSKDSIAGSITVGEVTSS